MLTPRLELIYQKIIGKKAADIGTDHAYIPIELIKSGRCEKVIASDIKKGPLEIAKKNIKAEGIHIDVRLGAGLSVLKAGEVEDIIIAGMGGKLICTIIEENMMVAKSARLILQPMNSQFELRKFLIENGFSVVDEDIAVEGFKVYNVLVCTFGGKGIIYNEEIDYHVPSCLKGHKYYKNLLDKKIREFTKIIKGYEKAKQPQDEEKLKLYKEYIQQLKKTDHIKA